MPGGECQRSVRDLLRCLPLRVGDEDRPVRHPVSAEEAHHRVLQDQTPPGRGLRGPEEPAGAGHQGTQQRVVRQHEHAAGGRDSQGNVSAGAPGPLRQQRLGPALHQPLSHAYPEEPQPQQE